MRRRTAATLICSVLLLFGFGPVSAERASRCKYDGVSRVSPRTQGKVKYCDPSFDDQAAGESTQVRQRFGGPSRAHHVIVKTRVCSV